MVAIRCFHIWVSPDFLEDDPTYKKRREAKMTSLKSKDHNWNTLFLGVNAVAEIMADKYKSSKSDVLDVQSKGGLALRMALGETQVVAETKEFLLHHGVKLDAFGQVRLHSSETLTTIGIVTDYELTVLVCTLRKS